VTLINLSELETNKEEIKFSISIGYDIHKLDNKQVLHKLQNNIP